jgi:hypothetical protein
MKGNAMSKTKQQVIEQIALEHLFIETLETQHRDRLDFHDVSVWAVKSALEAAYAAGIAAAQNTSPTSKGKK